MARRGTASSFATVRTIARDLPGVEEGTAWGVPALKLRGRFLACMASHTSAEPNTLVVLVGSDQRDAMIEDDPGTYYVKPHYVGHPCVLVRLSRIDREALADLLHAAWRFVDASAPGRRPSRRGAAPRRAAKH
jgi:hypothetical protein